MPVCSAAQSCQTFLIPWTMAHQAPLSLGFSWQEYWSWSPFPTPENSPSNSYYCCLVTQPSSTLCDPLDYSRPCFPVLHYFLEFVQTHVHWVMSNHLLFCHLLLLLPSIFPSIRVFYNELALRIRWLNYWSFSISSSNKYSVLISFRIDWFDLAVQGTLKSFLQHHSPKASVK